MIIRRNTYALDFVGSLNGLNAIRSAPGTYGLPSYEEQEDNIDYDSDTEHSLYEGVILRDIESAERDTLFFFESPATPYRDSRDSPEFFHDRNAGRRPSTPFPATMDKAIDTSPTFSERLERINFAPTDIPQNFICPLSHDIMNAPVVDKYANTYDELWIHKWLKDQKTSPLNRLPLSKKELKPANLLEDEIEDFVNQAERNVEEKIEEHSVLPPIRQALGFSTLFSRLNKKEQEAQRQHEHDKRYGLMCV